MHNMFPPSEALRHADACSGDDSGWLRSLEVYANVTPTRRREADKHTAMVLEIERESEGAVHATVGFDFPTHTPGC